MTTSPRAAGDDATTTDRILGGRVLYRQPRDGFRAAIDPVLLAAAIPARAGDTVLDGGTGAGAALLCLAARVRGIRGLGIDKDPALVRLAQENADANGWADLRFAAGDLGASPVGGPIDHAFANPPYHPPDGTPSPFQARDTAKRADPEVIRVWVAALAAPLRHRGTLTLILPPWLLEPTLTAMRDCRTPAETVFPVWPKHGRAARFLLIQGRRNGRSPLVVAAGLVLHADSGAFLPNAEAILRDGQPLALRPG